MCDLTSISLLVRNFHPINLFHTILRKAKTEGVQEPMGTNHIKRKVAMAIRVMFICTVALAMGDAPTSPTTCSRHVQHQLYGKSRNHTDYFSQCNAYREEQTISSRQTKTSGKVHVNQLSLELIFIEKQAHTSTKP